MPIFGRSKKSKETTSRRRDPKYTSRAKLHDEYVDDAQANPYNRQQASKSSQNVYNAHSMNMPNQYQPIQITQNFLITPPLPERPNKPYNSTSRLNLGSVSNFLPGNNSDRTPGGQRCNVPVPCGTQLLNQTAALCDGLSSTFDDIIALIDGACSREGEQNSFSNEPRRLEQNPASDNSRALVSYGKSSGKPNNYYASPNLKTTLASKVNLYANSRLPPNLKPMKLYVSTFPLIGLAAKYSESVYHKPRYMEKESHIDADWNLGTKAMVIKSVPMDDMNTIVLAIRGTKGTMDWAVNLRTVPASPNGFLDDVGNLCHAGFLTVARKMIGPITARLRQLLRENDQRSKYSLLITGHSAGGAVAALLYSHMLSTNRETKTDLNELTNRFKRIHCITFGAPPVSLLPLSKPNSPSLRKSLFMSFVNEGDPVTRADMVYFLSLTKLFQSPAPISPSTPPLKPKKSTQALAYGAAYFSNALAPASPYTPPTSSQIWKVPQATLSNAGSLVLLRGVPRHVHFESFRTVRDRMNDAVVAQMVTDDELRGVVWGDLSCHNMELYAKRIEVLATNAVMGRS